jgi:hypothetical protein
MGTLQPAVFQSGGQASSHYIPGAYSRIDFTKSAGGLSSINNAVIAGDARGGVPNTLLTFSSLSEAKAALRSGPLLDAIMHAFKPGPDYVPQRISAWRVNPGLQAGYSIKKTADTLIAVKAWDYGLHTNQVKIKIEAGTVSGKKITIAFMSETPWVADDVYRASITIQYTGSETACALSISDTALTTVTTAHTQELSCLFSTFPTIQDLVNYINDQPGYVCTVSSLNPTKDLSSQLDWQTSVAIKAAPVVLTSSLQAMIDALVTCPWIDTATYNVTASGRAVPDNVASWAYFTGGTDGAYTGSEWATSLTLLEKEDIQFVGSSSEDAAIHALIKTHCESMNSVTGKNERQFILGGASGETVAAFIVRCQNLNSWAGSLVYPEFQDWDRDSSQVIWWSPAYYAAKLIGMVTCVAIPEPLTNKQVSVLGFKAVSTTDIEKCIKNGGAVGRKTPTGLFVTTRMLTTYQGNELQKCEFSMVREALYINRDLRNAVEATFIGRAMTNGLLTDVDSTVNLKLNQYASLGLFNGDPMYWGYKRRVNGDQIIIEFNCYLTPPTNFIFITSHMAVYAQAAA